MSEGDNSRMKLRIAPTRAQTDAIIDDALRRAEAGQLGDEPTYISFQNWEHFVHELEREDAALAAELLSMPEEGRFALFETPAGQKALRRICDRDPIDTSCPG